MKTSHPFPEVARLGFGWFLPAAVVCALTACSSISSRSTQYLGEQCYPPGSPAAVEILRTEPMRSHVQLGEIEVNASTSPAPPIDKIEDKLRREAAKLGADAVVIVFDHIQPAAIYVTGGYWNRSVNTITGRKLIGVAIKYRSS